MWHFRVTVTYPNDKPVSERYASQEKALAVAAFVIDSPTVLCPVVSIQRVLVTEPVEGGAKTIVNPYQLGGTRHFSAAQFVHDQQDATVLVASQDGRFTIFKWSPCEEMVHAHRVEALLL